MALGDLEFGMLEQPFGWWTEMPISVECHTHLAIGAVLCCLKPLDSDTAFTWRWHVSFFGVGFCLPSVPGSRFPR